MRVKLRAVRFGRVYAGRCDRSETTLANVYMAKPGLLPANWTVLVNMSSTSTSDNIVQILQPRHHTEEVQMVVATLSYKLAVLRSQELRARCRI